MTEATATEAAAPKKPEPTRAGPFSALERMIALRYLLARRREAFISVISVISFLGIMLGVAALIIVMAVMNGFRAELLDRILGLNGHIIIQAIDRPLDDYEEVSARIAAVEGVKFAMPLVEGQTLASGAQGAGAGALARGLRPGDFRNLNAVADNIRQGSIDDFVNGEGVAIGTRMALNLGLAAGDTITLVSPEGDVTPLGVTPRVKSYAVAAVFEMGMSEYDASVIFMPLEEAQLYFNSEGTVQTIELFVDDPDSVDALKPKIEQAAARPLSIVDWRQRNVTFFSALQVERNVMFMILTLIVIVAALNIVSGLFMLVKDKGHDIAILRTMGATRGAIMRIFIMTGLIVGLAGTFAGFLLGVLVSANISAIQHFFTWITGANVWDPTVRFLSEIPADMSFGETMAVLLMAVFLSFLATLFPAWRAASLDPVEALRYE